MSSNTFTLILAVALAAGGRSGALSAGDSPGAGTVSGRVVDRLGEPVPGARLWAVVFRERVAEALADDGGRFRIEVEAPGDAQGGVDLWAEAEGLARGRREGVVVFPGRDHPIEAIPLLPGTRIAGRAVDAEGRPIPGASIGLELYRHVLGHTISSDQGEWSLRADDDGRFETPPLPSGSAKLTLSAPGKVRTFVGRKAEPGVEAVDLGDVTLADEVPIRGVVVDNEGAPAPGVTIIVDYDYENPATTDAEGRFVARGAGPDARQLRLQSNDYFAPEPFEVGEDREDLRLTVIKAYEILGSAVDAETGELVPIDSVRLCVVQRDPDDASITLVG
jgi:hypothetical protein